MRKPDGTYTRHCYFHNGPNEVKPPDLSGSGRPPVHGIFANKLRLPGMRADFDVADIDKLDDVIRLKLSYLAWAVDQHQENPTGGVPIGIHRGSDGHTSLRIRPWLEIIPTLEKELRLLWLARLEGLKLGGSEDARGALRELMDRVNAGDFER